ncbi:tRNA (guanosine(46)-N7)-methyltransferase TrmB [Companilactobacillus sp.]|jgi:tRNA (guanine-N7-)-methyltransferase|uniref:tRNA (guanosine(46)-N7)-methyltransferase TrmB n=1 Tax=Companilactobacillus sp. TaxID=2767905 RepID=UPI0025C34FAA|nr:tRNA (guanosine(46)-N7)-methyltransferase TrmB [Companilactobacillus sp.]MCH4007968.1 tRNA (guanosine(46)-N7)-methyltransferase TrmB [Companilactobacillus sp.]MCH4051853.1 tRNA (guanosine(46)-N7)-methyltransferase TrmB [Companilactobacillus sp.]MCH4075911.1 tRNA (guanosine(46)-N7)-methyltransferase TrmB [Companilactobacillus sp.]MCH4124486.1 tRNA (guanosine(46)-N7)-methyltransferase TrmB [Companilactobacillus sp.]MCH4132551.1 tRNA (guanosine(46)-N7)-methyltransferase TrmB [Companilactobacil
MRLRNKPWAKDMINENLDLISIQPEGMQGKWQSKFEKEQPLFLEVGSGKGRFITELAKQNPQNNYIAMEVQEGAIALLLKKQVENRLPNLQLLLDNGSKLTELFGESEVDGIYLNFSDPWPKTRHEKRRLTYKAFLQQYKTVLKDDGYVRFKTDNQGLFEYSLISMNNFGMKFDELSLDLHNDEALNQNNIQTEYEEKFSKKGFRINYLKAHFEK